MTYLFLDTNIFLHFQHYDQINWKNLVSEAEYKIVIPRIILDELDKKKYQASSKIASRAKSVLSKINAVVDDQTKGPNLFISPLRPRKKTYEQNELDAEHQDDAFLASMLEFIEIYPVDNVFLVTDDTGIKARAKFLNLQVLALPATYRLPAEKSAEEKELEIVKRELNAFKNRLPKVELLFKGGAQKLTITRPGPVNSLEEVRIKKMEEIKKKIPPMIIHPEDPNSNNYNEMISARFGLQHYKYVYNEALAAFYREYNRYVEKYYQYAIGRVLSFELNLELSNSGTYPATDISIQVNFPTGVEVTDKWLSPPEEPLPPYRPKDHFDDDIPIHFEQSISGNSNIDDKEPTTPSKYEKLNGYEVKFEVQRLKHGLVVSLDRLILQYSSAEDLKNFQIEYRLHLEELPAAVTGTLYVIFVDAEQM
jgi:rRNA-processing protein FCF1